MPSASKINQNQGIKAATITILIASINVILNSLRMLA